MQRTYWVLLLSSCLAAPAFAQVGEKDESAGDKAAGVAKNVIEHALATFKILWIVFQRKLANVGSVHGRENIS